MTGRTTMRLLVAMMGLLTILGGGLTAAAQSNKVAGDTCTLRIEGMACSACASRVEKEALKIEGVRAAKVDQPKGTAQITFDSAKTSAAAIAGRITSKTGFKAEVAEPQP